MNIQPASRKYVKDRFNLLDSDDSGKLDKGEFATVMKVEKKNEIHACFFPPANLSWYSHRAFMMNIDFIFTSIYKNYNPLDDHIDDSPSHFQICNRLQYHRLWHDARLLC